MEDLSKLLEVQQKLNAPKDKKNTFGGYNYRSCESILEAVKPILKEQGLVLIITDEIVEVGSRIYVKATAKLYGVKGNLISECTAYAREDEAKKGMDASQVTGATSSYARKYALNGLFAIDDNKDPDTDEFQKEKTAKTATEGKKALGSAVDQAGKQKPAEAPQSGKKPTPAKLELTPEQEEQYLQAYGDIAECDTLACVLANVNVVAGQPYEDAIRKHAAKTGIALAKSQHEVSEAYELIKGREGWQEVKKLAISTVNEKGLK